MSHVYYSISGLGKGQRKCGLVEWFGLYSIGQTGNGIILVVLPVYFLDTLINIVRHLVGVTVIASIQI